jgi:hypothetical protein
MIENVGTFPDNVVAFIAKGRVTKRDYDQVLIPKVEEALRQHDKISLYYEFGPEFSGIDPAAAWEDLREGIEHFTRWERMALVTDVDWIKQTLNAARFFVPGQLRVFPTAEASEAKAWLLRTETKVT